jgi:hypothetical protein
MLCGLPVKPWQTRTPVWFPAKSKGAAPGWTVPGRTSDITFFLVILINGCLSNAVHESRCKSTRAMVNVIIPAHRLLYSRKRHAYKSINP